jgi:aspartate carbamoyltransferase catalytic subunit
MQQHFLDLNQLSNTEIMNLIHAAKYFRDGAQVKLRRPVYMANLFFENSTRTHTSFEMAERRLGIVPVNIDPQHSSVQKGESLSDTVKTLQAIGMDGVVIRHRTTGWYESLKQDSRIKLSLVNAGDGSGQHPSQCLLDLLTMYDEFKTLCDLKVAIIGDLSHSRVARSDAEILQRFGATVYFAGPEEWYPRDFDKLGTYTQMDNIIHQVDIVMMLRVQLERLNQSAVEQFTAVDYARQYGLTVERAQKMKSNAIIMHPAPVNRDVEIADSLVEAPQSRIFRQMHNGVYARMAILQQVLQQQNLLVEASHEITD